MRLGADELAVLTAEPETPGELIAALNRPLPLGERGLGSLTLLELTYLRDFLGQQGDRNLRVAARAIDRFLWATAAAWIESEMRVKT